jgi:hypothetical protein
MDKIHIFRVRYGEACQTVLAMSAAAAVEVVRNEYEAEWGEGAFDLYDVEVEDDGENNSAYPVSLPTAQ